MTTTRTLVLVALIGACGPPRAQETILIGPQLGESTASGPSDPSRPPPDATGATEVSATISVAPPEVVFIPVDPGLGEPIYVPAQPAPPPAPAPSVTEPVIIWPSEPPPPAQPGVFSPPPDAGDYD